IFGLFYLFIIKYYYYYYSSTLSSAHIFRIYSACTFSSIMYPFIPFGRFCVLDSFYVVSVVRWLFEEEVALWPWEPLDGLVMMFFYCVCGLVWFR
ncbi:hypothetical protein GIB67_023756, partial [Kingdonia uniflora]